jgi:hypothetical protein
MSVSLFAQPNRFTCSCLLTGTPNLTEAIRQFSMMTFMPQAYCDAAAYSPELVCPGSAASRENTSVRS